MLIEFLDTVLVDKKPFVENLRININPENHQLRLKVTFLNGEEKNNIDIAVFNWEFKFDKLNPMININGQELNTKIKINLNILYDVFKHSMKVDGKINNNRIKFNVEEGSSGFLTILEKINLESLKCSTK